MRTSAPVRQSRARQVAPATGGGLARRFAISRAAGRQATACAIPPRRLSTGARDQATIAVGCRPRTARRNTRKHHRAFGSIFLGVFRASRGPHSAVPRAAKSPTTPIGISRIAVCSSAPGSCSEESTVPPVSDRVRHPGLGMVAQDSGKIRRIEKKIFLSASEKLYGSPSPDHGTLTRLGGHRETLRAAGVRRAFAARVRRNG